GFVAVEAARCAAGGTIEDVVRRAREVAERARICATIETFEFLRLSGRVNKLQAYAATILDIKPVFRMANGEAAPVARPRTRKRALARVVGATVSEATGRPLHLAAIHAAEEGEAREVLSAIRERTEVAERPAVPVTPSI